LREIDIDMALKNTLEIAIKRILSGALVDETRTKASVISPILRELGWDDGDPEKVLLEYSVPRGKTDYALLSAGEPRVFIEAKRLDNLNEKAETQLFEYASNQGVPLLVLTDGNVWDFYLSMAAGIPAERQFYKLSLRQEDKVSDNVKVFEKYLSREHICSGKAQKAAEEALTGKTTQRRINESMPQIWCKLLDAPDEMLRDLLVEEIENECGRRPDLDLVEEFLRKQSGLLISSEKLHREKARSTTSASSHRRSTHQPLAVVETNKKIVGYELDGEIYRVGAVNKTLAEILKKFHDKDPGFLDRFAGQVKSKTRWLVAKSVEDLYDLSHLRRHVISLVDGWLMGSNLSQSQVVKHTQIACRVANVRYGSQLRLMEE
jgi:hypothetical protein